MEVVIKKAVFPVAGLGTRFLPATKAHPKEMLPIVDKPLIQYAVEEAISAGIKELIFVTSNSKRAIEDHFDSNYELEHMLEQRGKYPMLAKIRNLIPGDVSCIYVRQPNPLGLGHAVLCAQSVVGNEPFAVLLADDLITSHDEKTCMQRMVERFAEHQASIIAVDQVPEHELHKYGVVGIKDRNNERCPLTTIVEKPSSGKAPSNLAAVGRYILTPHIFTLLAEQNRGIGNEIQLTDALKNLLKHESLYMHRLRGKRFDCGNHLGYLQATVNYALNHPQLGNEFSTYLRQHILEHE